MDPIHALILARFACVQAVRAVSELQQIASPEEAALQRVLALQKSARFAFGSALKYIPMDELKAECTIACSPIGAIAKAFPRRDGTANI
jgi:hypothetical protein